MGRVTLRDVAAGCGVSRATVSLVLQDSTRVSMDTKERVRATMRSLGYVYDRRAATLRSQRSMTIGMIVTDVRNPFFAELTMALENALHDTGYTLLLGYSHDELERQARLIGVMSEHRVDGVVLLPASGTPVAALSALVALEVPHVLVTREIPGYDADYVGVDNVAAGTLVREHLESLGVRSLAFLGGPEPSSARAERARGLGLEVTPKPRGVRSGPEQPARRVGKRGRWPCDIPTTAEATGGLRAVELLLDQGPLPDALVAYSDAVAQGVLTGLRARGLTPGRDVAVASFDDTLDARHAAPPLTSVATFPGQVGEQAARLLLRRLAHPEQPSRRILLRPTLEPRASSQLWTPSHTSPRRRAGQECP